MVDPKNGKYDSLPHVGPGNIESFTGRILDNVKSVKEDELISGKFHFQPGSIIYSKIRPNLKKYALPNFEGLASADTYILNTKNGVIQNYLFMVLQSNDFYMYSVSMSMRTGMPKINRDELNQYIYWAPTIDEQTKIGTFFIKLDDTIDLHQRKLTLLKRLKQTYLQGMIPQNNETSPALRCAGFSEPWEQHKLINLYEKGGSGGTPQSTNKSYYMGDIPFLGISDISASNGYIYDTEKHISERGLNNSSAWIVPKEAISLAMYASVGKVAILKTDAATSQAFYNMVFRKISTRNFVFQYLLKMESTNGWNSLISTGTQSNLNAQKVRDLEIMIPSLEEQDKIGAFFNRIDHTIDLHQKRISHIQDLKKAFLQKMFI